MCYFFPLPCTNPWSWFNRQILVMEVLCIYSKPCAKSTLQKKCCHLSFCKIQKKNKTKNQDAARQIEPRRGSTKQQLISLMPSLLWKGWNEAALELGEVTFSPPLLFSSPPLIMSVHIKMSLTIYPEQCSTSTQGHLASRFSSADVLLLLLLCNQLMDTFQLGLSLMHGWKLCRWGLHPSLSRLSLMSA